MIAVIYTDSEKQEYRIELPPLTDPEKLGKFMQNTLNALLNWLSADGLSWMVDQSAATEEEKRYSYGSILAAETYQAYLERNPV